MSLREAKSHTEPKNRSLHCDIYEKWIRSSAHHTSAHWTQLLIELGFRERSEEQKRRKRKASQIAAQAALPASAGALRWAWVYVFKLYKAPHPLSWPHEGWHSESRPGRECSSGHGLWQTPSLCVANKHVRKWVHLCVQG